MDQAIKRRIIKGALFGLSGIILLGAGIIVLFYSGVLWFNMPSRDQYPVRGVDVSHYQGRIDWTVLAQEDISFAFIKATEGSGTVDECFAANWTAAQDTALYVGAYHFFSFDSAGQTQAENFISTVPVCENALPPVIDLEYYGDKAAHPPAYDAVCAELSVLIDALTAHYGAAPIIYTTTDCYTRYLEPSDVDCPLWIRDVLDEPEITGWDFWQYSNFGRLDGYAGEESRMDMNVYRGSEQEFRAQFALTEK